MEQVPGNNRDGNLEFVYSAAVTEEGAVAAASVAAAAAERAAEEPAAPAEDGRSPQHVFGPDIIFKAGPRFLHFHWLMSIY
jgi:hypothetical protein